MKNEKVKHRVGAWCLLLIAVKRMGVSPRNDGGRQRKEGEVEICAMMKERRLKTRRGRSTVKMRSDAGQIMKAEMNGEGPMKRRFLRKRSKTRYSTKRHAGPGVHCRACVGEHFCADFLIRSCMKSARPSALRWRRVPTARLREEEEEKMEAMSATLLEHQDHLQAPAG